MILMFCGFLFILTATPLDGALVKSMNNVNAYSQTILYLQNCSQWFNGDFINKTSKYWSHCNNTSLTTLSNEINFWNFDEFICLGTISADVSLCKTKEKYPANAAQSEEDLKSQLASLTDKTPNETCDAIQKLPVFQYFNNLEFQSPLKVLNNSLHSPQCNRICTDLKNSNKTIDFCVWLHYIYDHINLVLKEETKTVQQTTHQNPIPSINKANVTSLPNTSSKTLNQTINANLSMKTTKEPSNSTIHVSAGVFEDVITEKQNINFSKTSIEESSKKTPEVTPLIDKSITVVKVVSNKNESFNKDQKKSSPNATVEKLNQVDIPVVKESPVITKWKSKLFSDKNIEQDIDEKVINKTEETSEKALIVTKTEKKNVTSDAADEKLLPGAKSKKSPEVQKQVGKNNDTTETIKMEKSSVQETKALTNTGKVSEIQYEDEDMEQKSKIAVDSDAGDDDNKFNNKFDNDEGDYIYGIMDDYDGIYGNSNCAYYENCDDDELERKRTESIVDDDINIEEESHFFSYFMIFSFLFIGGYIVYHNKQKIMALLLEGRRNRNLRRRPNTANYRKLNCNLEEAVTSKYSRAAHVIY